MSRLALVDRTKLNLQEVTVLLQGGSRIEVDMLIQLFTGFGTGHLRRAESLAQMREALANEPIDLAVLDVTAGLEETLEVVRELRRMSTATRYAPVVLTTANAYPSLLNDARDAGVSYVVTKPLSPRVLFDRLIWIVKDARSFIEVEGYVGPDRRVRLLGPPSGMAGRREGDLAPEVGDASTPNMSQTDIDSMFPVRKAV